ncbi:MAG: hypothetical protein L3J78_03755 [Thermoplasmata archaeon]|nr:hypothetical protein [Thermoplasmata archaeon]
MSSFQTRDARLARREVLLVALAAIASVLFFNHEVLYGGGAKFQVPPSAGFVVVTIIIYLFLRLTVVAAAMRFPRRHAELIRCPECGQWLDDPTAEGLDAHRRVELTPRPTRKEVVSAIALRRAVDAARVGIETLSPRAPEELRPPSEVERLSGADLIAALNDPDLLERLRHSPQAAPRPPTDPILKR